MCCDTTLCSAQGEDVGSQIAREVERRITSTNCCASGNQSE
jgi:hypothetical protein